MHTMTLTISLTLDRPAEAITYPVVDEVSIEMVSSDQAITDKLLVNREERIIHFLSIQEAAWTYMLRPMEYENPGSGRLILKQFMTEVAKELLKGNSNDNAKN